MAILPVHSLHMAGMLWACASTGLFLLPYLYHHILAHFIRGIACGMVMVAIQLYSYQNSNASAMCISTFHVSISLGSLLALIYSYASIYYSIEAALPYVSLSETAWGLLILFISFLLSGSPLASSVNGWGRDFRSHLQATLLPTWKTPGKIGKTGKERKIISTFWNLSLRSAHIHIAAVLTNIPTLMPMFTARPVLKLIFNDTLLEYLHFLQYTLVALFSCCLLFLCCFKRKDCYVFGMFILGLSNAAICILLVLQGNQWFQITRAYNIRTELFLALTLFSFCLFYTFVQPMTSIYSIELVHGCPKAVAVVYSIMWLSKAIALVSYECILSETVDEWIIAAIASAMCLLGAISILFYPEPTTYDSLTRVGSTESNKVAKSLISTKSFSSKPDTSAGLSIFGLNMTFQNYIPLFKNSEEKRENLEISSDFLLSESTQDVPRRESALRMVTARSHFSGGSLLESVQDNDELMPLMTALWTSDLET